MAIAIIGTLGMNKLRYAPIANAMAGGAKINSIFCAIPPMKPQFLPNERLAYSNAPPAFGIAHANSV